MIKCARFFLHLFWVIWSDRTAIFERYMLRPVVDVAEISYQ